MIVNGVSALVRAGFSRDYDPSRGPSFTQYYEGTKEAIEELERQLVGVRYEVDYTSPPIAKLSITQTGYSENEDPNAILDVQYELLANTSSKSIFEHPVARALGQAVILQIRDALDRSPGDAAPSFTGNTLKIYDMAITGQDTYIDSQFVFRVTQIIGRRANEIPVAFTDVNKIYTTAEMLAEISTPRAYTTAIQLAAAAAQASFGTIPADYTLGWLKQAPTLNTVADNKIALNFEYWCYAWSDLLYS